MLKPVEEASKKIGLPPRTLVHIGEKRTGKAKITALDYDEEKFQEKVVEEVEECLPFKEQSTVTWINVDGIHQVEVIEQIGEIFGLHPLLLEDVLNTGQRPKLEDFDEHLFIVLKMFYYDEEIGEVTSSPS